MSKRVILVALGGINLLLLAMLLYSSTSLPRAVAQPAVPAAGGGGTMIAVTSRISGDLDGLFLLDVAQGRLTLLVPQRDSGQLSFVTQRNIQEDFQAFAESISGKP